MPAKMILAMLFLISLCVVVVLGLRALPQRVAADPSAVSDQRLVATMVLPSGTLLRAKDVVWQRIAGGAEPDDILRPPSAAGTPNLDLDQQARAAVYGAALRTGVTAGDPISRGGMPGIEGSVCPGWRSRVGIDSNSACV